jgi:hypothetical protein
MLVMTRSWFEPVIFFLVIAVSILLNMGTNWIFRSISFITFAVASILQLALALDYSIMLMNRYRQEKAAGLGNIEAMASALRNCFPAVAGSALTTAAGLFALAFMHFKIGMDLGFVLAKGVLLSLVCVLTVLPAVVLMVAHHGLLDVEPGQHQSGVPGVLRRHEIHGGEDLQSPGGDVRHIADGGGDEIQGAALHGVLFCLFIGRVSLEHGVRLSVVMN